MYECPHAKEEIKKWVLEEFRTSKTSSKKNHIMSKNLTPPGSMMIKSI